VYGVIGRKCNRCRRHYCRNQLDESAHTEHLGLLGSHLHKGTLCMSHTGANSILLFVDATIPHEMPTHNVSGAVPILIGGTGDYEHQRCKCVTLTNRTAWAESRNKTAGITAQGEE
jgi:hypothetical protein